MSFFCFGHWEHWLLQTQAGIGVIKSHELPCKYVTRKEADPWAHRNCLSITGSLFENLDLTLSSFGHEVMAVESKCLRMSSLTLCSVNDSSSKWDKNWTSHKFIMKHYRRGNAFWAFVLKISKCSQLFVLLALHFLLLLQPLPLDRHFCWKLQGLTSSVPGLTVKSQIACVWILQSQIWNYSLTNNDFGNSSDISGSNILTSTSEMGGNLPPCHLLVIYLGAFCSSPCECMKFTNMWKRRSHLAFSPA